MLLARGANIMATNAFVTRLHFTANVGHEEIVKLLTSRGWLFGTVRGILIKMYLT